MILLGPVVALVALFVSDRSRSWTLGAVPGVVLGSFLAAAIQERARPLLLDRFARDTAPFIAAFQAHFEDHQRIPKDFDELVPEYLDELPSLPPLQAHSDQHGGWLLKFTIFEDDRPIELLVLRSEALRANFGASGSSYERIRPWEVF